MSDLTIGSLFSGYGGLDMAVESVTGARTAWVSDIDKGACKILAHRAPGIPNHGDLTTIDWAAVEPVDIITGGFPCQDLSHAGKRAGMADGTRSGLWSCMCEAIKIIRPRLVVAENVRGLLSAEALRPVEPCTWCVGDDADLDMRALGAVLADLADIGYDASWYGLRAADVGACHGRFRVFLVAYPERSGRERLGSTQLARPSDHAAGNGTAPALLPTPRTSDTNGAGVHGEGGIDLRTAVTLLPSPRATDGSNGGPNQRGSKGDLMLPSAVTHLLPTPTTQDAANNGGPSQLDRNSLPLNTLVTLLPTPRVTTSGSIASQKRVREVMAGDVSETADCRLELTMEVQAQRGGFGQYADAITRWESVIGRPAPSPTEPTGKGGAQRLSPEFTTWMMGLPDGWITDVPGITRNEALKACGNGVVPAQAAAALRLLLATERAA